MAAVAQQEFEYAVSYFDGNAARELSSHAQPGYAQPEYAPQRKPVELPADPLAGENVKTRVRAKHNVSVLAMAGYAGFLLLMVLVIFSQVRLYEVVLETAELESRLAELKAEEKQLMLQFEGSVNLDEVEQIASTQLGMSRPQSEQVFYVDLSNPDKAEIVSSGDEETRVSALVAAVRDAFTYIRDFLGK